MALLFMEGFDHHATADLTAKWTTIGGSPTVGASYKRNGTNGCETAYGDQLDITVPTTTSTLGVCGFAFYRTDSQSCVPVVIRSGSGAQLYVKIMSDSTIQVYGGGNATIGSASSATVSSTAWHYLEVKWLIGDSGTVQVYLDGNPTPVVNVAGDTAHFGATDWTQVRFGGNQSGGTIWLDDIYVCDQTAAAYGPSNDDILGDVVVKTVLPSTGNGSNTNFLLSTGTDHGALVDESTPNTTDYVYSSTATDVDSWNYPALSVTGTVLGVQLSLYAQKSDSGTRTLAGVARPASTNRVGSTQTPTTSWVYYRQVWDYNPETDSTWTVAAIDASEFGVKVIA